MAGELISREALERIIRRAAQLPAGAPDLGDGVTQLEPGFCHVQLVASVQNQRRARLSGAAALAALAIAVAALATAVPLAIISPILFAKAALLGAAALFVVRRHRAQNERVQVGLEQVLDRLERGEIRADHALPGSQPSALVRIAEEFRSAL